MSRMKSGEAPAKRQQFPCDCQGVGRRNVDYHDKQPLIKEIINGIVPKRKSPIMPHTAESEGWRGGC